MKKFTLFLLTMLVSVVSAFADVTATTSMDGKVVTKLSDLDNLKLTFDGASSIAILGDEDCQYMALQNEDGSELYGIWGPTMGSEYTIEGNSITLAGFMPYEGATVAIPAGTTKLYIEDYGTLAIDGEATYVTTIELNANFTAGAAPFTLTSVANNAVAGSAVGVEASEQGISYMFEVTATGKALSQGEGVPTLSLMEDASVDFGAAGVLAYGAETAYIRFMTPQQQFFTTPGTYVLTIPEGTFVDAEGNPNAAAVAKWVIIQGEEKTPFAITCATNAGNEAGAEVDVLSYSFEIAAANAITGLHEGNITLTDANNQPVGGNALVYGYEGEGGATTVYARFNFDSEDHMLHTPGVYTLNVPAGMFVDAEGALSEAYSASWTIKGAAAGVTDFSADYTTNVEFAAGENSYLTDIINIDGVEYNAYKIGTSKKAGSCKVILPAGTTHFALHAIGWSKSDNTPLHIEGAGINADVIAGTGNISGNSPYTFDTANYDPKAPYFSYEFDALTEDTEVTLSSDYRVVFYGVHAEAVKAEPATFAITGATFAGQEAGAEVEALSYMAEITAANAITGMHEGNITLTDANNQPVGGNAYVFGYEGEAGSTTVYARFTFDSEDHMLHNPGVYTLNVPAGMFVDAEGNLSEAYTASWTIKENIPAGSFAITGATIGGAEAGAEVEALSYSAEITAANAITALHEGNITLTDTEGQPVGGNAYVFGYEGEGGSTTVYARFNFDSEDHMLHTAGTYTLNVPAGMFVDAEGNLSEAYTASWTVKENTPAATFAITGATIGGQEAGAEVEALSYMAEITAANAIVGMHEGNITLTDANNQPVGGNAYVYGYEGEAGSTSVYARFTFDSEDHMLHTPGVYTLNVPAGMFVDAEGNLSEAYSASWTVKAPEGPQTINIENVEIATVTEGEFNDVRYTATFKLAKPEGAAYAYSEGLLLTLDGEASVPFQFGGTTGVVELGEGNEITLVYKDAMIAKTSDADYDGELRAVGSYVGTTEIYFMDADQLELPCVAKFTGSIILPEIEEEEQPAIADGDYLIMNVSGGYLGGGQDWGTHATLLGKPQWFTVALNDGTYTLDSHQSNGGNNHFLGSNMYVDAAAYGWTLTALDDEHHLFTITNAEGKYLASNGINQLVTLKDAAEIEDPFAMVWSFVPMSKLLEDMAEADNENPVDVTALIKNPELKRNAGQWTTTGFDGTGNAANFAMGQGANNANCAESYKSSNGFKTVQTITLPKAGKYVLSAQAFYRIEGGVEGQELPYLFAGDKMSNFPEIKGTENSMPQAYEQFLQKNYTVDAISFETLEDNETVEIGFAGSATSMWNIFGELELQYMGVQPAIADGDYLVMNVSGGYLGGGQDWGTHATLLGKPQWFTVALNDGTYTLDSHQSNGGAKHFLGSNMYVDSDAYGWTLTALDDEHHLFTITNAEGQYLTSNGTNQLVTLKNESEIEDPFSMIWSFVPMSKILEDMDNAAEDNAIDVTALIKNPELKRNAGQWTTTGFDGTDNAANFAMGQGANNANCAESYMSSNGFKTVQTITLPKAGKYVLSAQAFYRIEGGVEGQELPYLFAGDKMSNFPEIKGTENSMPQAYAQFLEKNYTVDGITIVTTEADQTVEIGFAGSATSMWNIFGELELLYMGEASATPELFDLEIAAAVSESAPNTWGDQFYTVTLIVPNIENELSAKGVQYAYSSEGLTFTAGEEKFTFMAVQAEGVEVAAGENAVLTFKDYLPSYTSDTTYDGELRAQGTYPATCIISLVDAEFNEVGYALFEGELTLSHETGINGVDASFTANRVIYNLNGQKMQRTVKGINIINGKKVILK